MLISDTLEVTNQMLLKIGKFLFCLEVSGSNTTPTTLERANKPLGLSQLPNKSQGLSQLPITKPPGVTMRDSNTYRAPKDDFAPLDPYRFEWQNSANSVSFSRKFNVKPARDSFEQDKSHKHEEELSQDMWKYYEDLLNDDTNWEALNGGDSKEKKSNHAPAKNAPSNIKVSFTGLLKPRASETETNMRIEKENNMRVEKENKMKAEKENHMRVEKENSAIRKQSETPLGNPRVESRNSLAPSESNKSFTENSSAQVIRKLLKESVPKLPLKQEDLENSFVAESPCIQNARRRNKLIIDSESGAKKEELDEFDKTIKRVKTTDQSEDQSAHGRIEKKLIDPTPEESVKKKVTRRKKMHIEEDDGPCQFNSEDSWKDNNSASLDHSRGYTSSFHPMTKEATTPEKRSAMKAHTLSFEESKLESTPGGDNDLSNSQMLRRKSTLSDNQLKRLKKLVEDKRDAAGKHSVEKQAKNSQSQPLKETCSICICNDSLSSLFE